MPTPPRFFNVSTIARAGGIAVSTVQRRIRDLKLEPAGVLDPLGREPQPLYDADALAAVTIPFLKVRQGCTEVRRRKGGWIKETAVPPVCPDASDVAVLASMRRGDVADLFKPDAASS